nr:putative uncharacterized protein encoded by LINC01556 [Macaca nemestrina]
MYWIHLLEAPRWIPDRMLQVVQEGNLAPFVINTVKRGRRDRERQRTPRAPHPLGLRERLYICESPNHRGNDCSFLAQK